MIFENPKVVLIDQLDDRDEVWRISRPHLKPTDKDLMDITKVDLPIHSFGFVIFYIRGSILLRDILYHIRPTSDWARSNRTTNIDKDTLVYSSEFRELVESNSAEEDLWTECVDTSVSLDFRKDKFPYYMSTEFCWGCDFRTLVTVLRSMYRSIPYLFNIYGKMMIEALGYSSLSELPPGSDKLFQSLAADPKSTDKVIINHDFDSVMIQYTGSGSLMSQFIRQHMSRVRTSFMTKVIDAGGLWDVYKMRQNDLYVMQVLTNVESAKRLISTRACFFAKFDKASKSSWSDIITELIKEFGGTLLDYLPCHGNKVDKCPWKTEQLARCIANNPTSSKGEVNPPCPIITGIPEILDIRKAKFDSNSKLFKLWSINKSILPNKITDDGVKYLTNVVKYGFVEECDNSNEEMNDIIYSLATEHNII